MTKLQLAVESNSDSGNSSPVVRDHDGIRPYHLRFGPFSHPLNETSPDDKTAETSTSDENHQVDQDAGDNDDYDQPLGYQNFLCDVIVEHSPGGNRSNPSGTKYCFKMKRLPYMVVSKRDELGHDSLGTDDDLSDNTNDCDLDTRVNKFNEDTFDLTSFNRMPIDVSKETCAFLSNSDYVPSTKFKNRKVTLELVSAKLSLPSGHHISSNPSSTSLPTLEEAPHSTQHDTSSRWSNNSHSSASGSNQDFRSQSISHSHLRIAPPPSPLSSPSPSSLSSKKFVSYTILIKTIPGLDKHPAVIERRFSDFFDLYQGLMNQKSYADIIEKSVTFPKKVYMGNYSFEKIAERSIEFTKLLHLCISNKSLLWSEPFVSFLFDKEIKEAHNLSLSGDLDDVQALIENAYYIEQKLYSSLSPKLSANGSSM